MQTETWKMKAQLPSRKKKTANDNQVSSVLSVVEDAVPAGSEAAQAHAEPGLRV